MLPMVHLAHLAIAWAEELIQNLHAMMHKMWIACNVVIHEIDDKGHKIKEGLAMDADIDGQFDLRYEALLWCNYHLISIGKAANGNHTALPSACSVVLSGV